MQAITATGINSSNYSYDAIGNLANDSGESIGVTWNAMNKVKTVVTPNSTLHFAYSPTGQRQIKKTGDKTEYYLHDATGNIMCVYELSGNYLTVKERTIYGSKRIGVYRQRIQLSAFTGFGQAVLLPGSGLVNVLHPSPIISPDGRQYLEGSNRLQVIGVVRTTLSVNTLAYKKGTIELKGLSPSIAARPTFLDGTKTAGLRDYELTDHLSNVMAVISDRKLSVDTNSDTITDYYEPQVVSFTDYYPFGFPIAERSGNLSGYRFGFNGQEADNEVYGVKQSYTAEFWQYDSRLGRRWNLDSKGNAFFSLYGCFGNSPIMYSDVLGDTVRYNSFRERVDVLIARVFSKAFRKEFRELKKSEKIYIYNRIDREDVFETGEEGNISVNEEFTYEKDDSQKMRSNPKSFTINYSIISKDVLGRSPFHALFEETFHAVDFELGRSSSMIGYSESDNSFFLGHNLFDRSHEARAWQFAAINAPFYRSCPKLISAEGNEYYLLSSLVSQIRMLHNVDNKKNINDIIDLLYNKFTTRYRYVGEERIREKTTSQLYH